MKEPKGSSESTRLEQLWGGDFGDQYIKRNLEVAEDRKPFWDMMLSEFDIASVLEVGCNVGGNLQWLSKALPMQNIYAIDINEQAIINVRKNFSGVNAICSPAKRLPFRDEFFDLTFTTGVLIHQPQETLPLVMNEIVRCSRRYVLCGEYYADKLTEIPYHGEQGALFKRDFGGMYKELFPELELLKDGFLPKEQGGWDDIRYWIFKKN